QEYKQVIQPFEFFYCSNNLRIKSLYKYKTLENISLLWELYDQGKLNDSDKISLVPIPAFHMSEGIRLPISKQVTGEAFLNFSIIQNKGDSIFETGKTIGR